MGAPITISPASHFHAPVLAALHTCCFDDPWDDAAMAEVMAMAGVFGLMASIGGKPPTGFMLCRTAADECEIITIGVVPECRRAGVAAALVAAAAQQAARAGVKKMFLEVAEDNSAAIKLYRGAGFREAGRREGYYQGAGQGGEAKTDALILRKEL